jgi:hypothetical protein
MARTGTETVAFDLVVPGVGLDGASRADGDFVRLEIPGLDRVGEIGEPMLPALRRFVEIPQGAAAEVATAVLQRSTLDLAAEGLPATLCPVQAPMPTCDYGALTMVVGQ